MAKLFAILLAYCLLSISHLAIAFEPIGTPDLDDIEYPDDEPPSKEEVELGKLLFFDPRLSINDKQSCATCHNPDLGFSDGMVKGIGTKGTTAGRNTPSIYNLAWNVVFFWDGRNTTLEEQALQPIVADGEMAMPLDLLVTKLKGVPYYDKTFATVYADEGITENTIARAIAAFERSINTLNSPFDHYMAGNKSAMSAAAIRGMKLFEGKANCIKCHDGPNFTDNSFHNIGVNDQDEGRGAIIRDPSLKGTFKTPGLRNISLTAPYMHDGSEGSLEDVIRFYNRGGDKTDNLSNLIKPLKLTEQEIFDLVAFLGALTDPVNVERPVIP